MPIRVYYEVLNQKGTPALYSDNYAQRPAAGYVGRIFYSPDTAQIFYDTGSTWTLLADAGVGSGSLASVCANGNTTATGISITAGGLSTNSLTSTNLTAGSIPFIGTGGLFSQDNSNLFWDNTNKWLGLNTNTPTAPFDIHTTANIGMQINNTTTADSKIAFLNAGVGKWRIGNLYSGGANLFHIYNNAGVTLAMQIDSSNAALFYGSLSSNSFISAASGITLTNGGTTTTAGATNIGGLTAGLSIALASGFNQTLTFPTGVAYTYTFPSATGTLALTSNLSSYLPLAGGTLTGQLVISNANTPQLQVTHSGTGTATIYVTGTSGYSTILWTGGAGGGYGQMSYNLAGNYMQYGTNASEYMRMYSNGNLRLFTSSSTDSGAKFQVEGTSFFSGQITANSGVKISAGASINTTAGTGYNAFELGTNATAAGWYIYDTTNSAYRLTLTNGGNILIGTSTDNGSKLRVQGSAFVSSALGNSTGFMYSINQQNSSSFDISTIFGTGVGHNTILAIVTGTSGSAADQEADLFLLTFYNGGGTSTRVSSLVSSVITCSISGSSVSFSGKAFISVTYISVAV